MYGHLASLVFAFLTLPGPSCINSDNLALLSSTLKTMQRAACDDKLVSLSCPRGTAINIQVAQYGKAITGNHDCMAEILSSSPEESGAEDQKCLWPNIMQYSLLQTVVEACQKKLQCTFSTKPKPGLTDPCPQAKKFVEVAYKCRPNVFRSRTGCYDDVIKLGCNPHTRIAILNAQFGRTIYEPITCPQPLGVGDENCSAPHAVEAVMQTCHGKRHCEVIVNEKTFGTPCNRSSKPYIKVTFACVSLGVLNEKYESAAEEDEIADHRTEIDREDEQPYEPDDADTRWEQPNVITPIANPALQSPSKDIAGIQKTEYVTVAPKKNTNSRNEPATSSNKLYMYLGIGFLIFIILTILLIGVRCYIIRQTSKKSKADDLFSVETPNVFNDAVSDIDNDIDISHLSGSFYDPIHPDMILYRDVPGSKGTIRAMRPLSTIYPCAGTSMYGNVDYVPSQHREVTNHLFRKERGIETDPELALSPRSLSRYSNSQFYDG